MDKQKVLSRLIQELQSFLVVLDTESLSYMAQTQKKSLSELLAKLHTTDPPVEDAEYMFMSCPSLSPRHTHPDTSLAEAYLLSEQETQRESADIQSRSVNGRGAGPYPGGHLVVIGDDDEDEEDDDEEGNYEEAEPYVPEQTSNNIEKAETESSHYEVYGEEGEELVKDRAHYIQWTASQPCLRSAPEARLCGYLWRRRWLGRWSKQLFVIRSDALLCYRSAKDLLPQLEMGLQGCQVLYRPRTTRGLQHELRVSDTTQTLVLGLNDPQQAAEWKRVIEDISCGGVDTLSCSSQAKSEITLSCRSSSELQSDEEDDGPPDHNNSNKGFLNVLMNFQWQSLLCQVGAGLLKMFGEEEGLPDEGGERPPQYTVPLRGAEVLPGPDTEHSYRITLSMHGLQMAVLEARCLDDKQRWLQLLREEADPHYPPRLTAAPDGTDVALRGLQTRRFPHSNLYMEDLFHSQPVYSNSSVLRYTDGAQECLLFGDTVTYSNTHCSSHNRSLGVKPSGGGLGRPWRAGSELNLASTGKQNKRMSFRQSLALCSERAQAGLLAPLLRRTASAKTSLKRAPSALFIQQDKVCPRPQEHEHKTAA